jgi:hypothetical protein
MKFSKECRINIKTYLTELLSLVEHFKCSSPSNVTVQWDFQPVRKSAVDLGTMEVLDALWRRLDLWKKLHVWMIMNETLTLIDRVQIAAITSREPPNTRFPSRVGSYSQIAVTFSMAAILVICPITSMFLRLTTCPRQLKQIQLEKRRKFKE